MKYPSCLLMLVAGCFTMGPLQLGAADPVVPLTSLTPPVLLPLNNNTAPPFKAVYRWGQGGCAKGEYDAYGPWLNRTVIWGEDFMPIQGWNKIQGENWQLGTWRDWVKKQPGRRFVLSLPILVGSWDGKGPKEGPAAGEPVSLEEGAKGTYNIYYQHLAENLVKYELGDSIIRIGWEFNGGWYIWRANNAAKAEAFAGYFKQIVATMRAVPGAEKLRFVWNPAMEPHWEYPPEKAWPGDEYVDYVGVDVYDQCWAKDTYPIPEGTGEEEALTRQKRTWNNITNNEKAYGLPFWVKFSKAHGKPLTIPEWGVCNRKDKHGGGDNPFFIQQMFDFIQNPANNVYFECYFDVEAGDGHHQLSTGLKGDFKTEFPQSAELFQKLYSLPKK